MVRILEERKAGIAVSATWESPDGEVLEKKTPSAKWQELKSEKIPRAMEDILGIKRFIYPDQNPAYGEDDRGGEKK